MITNFLQKLTTNAERIRSYGERLKVWEGGKCLHIKCYRHLELFFRKSQGSHAEEGGPCGRSLPVGCTCCTRVNRAYKVPCRRRVRSIPAPLAPRSCTSVFTQRSQSLKCRSNTSRSQEAPRMHQPERRAVPLTMRTQSSVLPLLPAILAGSKASLILKGKQHS